MRATHGLTLVLLLVSAASCKKDEADQRTDTMDVQKAVKEERASLPVEVVAQLDSGSAAYRAGNLRGALAYYNKATEIDSTVAAAWFGVFMAQQALGDSTAAADALARAQSLDPGATLIRGTEKDTVR